MTLVEFLCFDEKFCFRSSNFWTAEAIVLIFWKGTHVRSHGPSFTEGSTGRVLRKKPPRNVPRGLKSSKGPSSEPLFKTLWLRGIKSPKCVRLREIKLYGKTEFLFNNLDNCTLCLIKLGFNFYVKSLMKKVQRLNVLIFGWNWKLPKFPSVFQHDILL